MKDCTMKDCQKEFLEPSSLLSSTIVSSSTNTVSLQLSKAALDVIHELLVRFDLDGDNSWSVDELNLYQKETGLLDYTSEHPLGSLNIPYCAGLFVHELESMHLQVKLVQ